MEEEEQEEEEDLDPFSLEDQDIVEIRSGSEEHDSSTPSSSSLSQPIDVEKPANSFFDLSNNSQIGSSSHYSSWAASMSSLASTSSLASGPLPPNVDFWTQPSPTSSATSSLRRASSAATTTPRDVFSLSPTQNHPSPTPLPWPDAPAPAPPRISLHPSHLAMIKVEPSISSRRDHATDAVQLFISDVAEADLRKGGPSGGGVASFFSVVKDEGGFSVTGDPVLMERRFDEVTEDQLREAREGMAAETSEQQQQNHHTRPSHRRAVSCPYSTLGTLRFTKLTTHSKTGSSSSNNSSSLSLDLEHAHSLVSNATSAFDEDAGCILRCLQVHLSGEEGLRKSGIIRR